MRSTFFFIALLAASIYAASNQNNQNNANNANNALIRRGNDQFDFLEQDTIIEEVVETKIDDTTELIETIQTAASIRRSGKWISGGFFTLAILLGLTGIVYAVALAISGVTGTATYWTFVSLLAVTVIVIVAATIVVFLRH